jgi:hypothetical protein
MRRVIYKDSGSKAHITESDANSFAYPICGGSGGYGFHVNPKADPFDRDLCANCAKLATQRRHKLDTILMLNEASNSSYIRSIENVIQEYDMQDTIFGERILEVIRGG